MTVLIVGAGPAGLVLGNLLLAEGIDCEVVERQSRGHVENRARAGFLATNSVRVLDRNGLAAGLHRNGQQHSSCAFRFDHGEFELNYAGLGRREGHTVYPQQDLVADLIAEFLARGGRIRFDTAVTGVHDAGTDRPWITCTAADGSELRLDGRFVAGCDGRHGAAQAAVPGHRYSKTYGITWLALLAAAPQSMPTVTYAIHPEGFAGHMARGPMITRYYLQCAPDDGPDAWPDERVWAELGRRMRTDRYGPLHQGPIVERRVIDMVCYLHDPIQHGSLFLAGDAASLVSPAAAKGANLAIMAAERLARALTAAIRGGDEEPLRSYSADCLPHLWRAQEFTQWMIHLLCGGPANDDDEAQYQRALQLARLESLRTSRRHQDYFAENYISV